MRIAIYHPNLHYFGGGETVALTIASELSKSNTVDIYTPFKVDKIALQSFFDQNLDYVNLVEFGSSIKKIPGFGSIKPSLYLHSITKKLETYDLVIDTSTNGWFDKKLKTKTICYVHFPYFQPKKTGIKSLLNQFLIKPENAFNYDRILCNSNFTKNEVSKLTNKKLEVLYPPVEIDKIKPAKKLKKIVTVGRFTYEKKHEVLIDAFKALHEKKYSLHLIGSFQENTELYEKNYLESLYRSAEGFEIKFHLNMSHTQVLAFLSECKLYWHARGFGETKLNEYENFGITTVEAMAAGCVPVTINLGAQPEIVQNRKSGYTWNSPFQLIAQTRKLIKSKKSYNRIKKNAIKEAKKYSSKIFKDRLNIIIKQVLKS